MFASKKKVLHVQAINSALPNDKGFDLLGISRKELTDCLLKLQDNQRAQQLLAPEIAKHLLLRQYQYLASSEQLFYIEKFKNELTTFRIYLKELNQQYFKDVATQLNWVQMISWLEKHGYAKSAASLKEEQKRTMDIFNKLVSCCVSADCYAKYIKAYLGDQPLGYLSMLLFAQKNSITLYLLRKEKKNDYELIDNTSFYEAKKPAQTIYLALTDNDASDYTDYNRLSDQLFYVCQTRDFFRNLESLTRFKKAEEFLSAGKKKYGDDVSSILDWMITMHYLEERYRHVPFKSEECEDDLSAEWMSAMHSLLERDAPLDQENIRTRYEAMNEKDTKKDTEITILARAIRYYDYVQSHEEIGNMFIPNHSKWLPLLAAFFLFHDEPDTNMAFAYFKKAYEDSPEDLKDDLLIKFWPELFILDDCNDYPCQEEDRLNYINFILEIGERLLALGLCDPIFYYRLSELYKEKIAYNKNEEEAQKLLYYYIKYLKLAKSTMTTDNTAPWRNQEQLASVDRHAYSCIMQRYAEQMRYYNYGYWMQACFFQLDNDTQEKLKQWLFTKVDSSYNHNSFHALLGIDPAISFFDGKIFQDACNSVPHITVKANLNELMRIENLNISEEDYEIPYWYDVLFATEFVEKIQRVEAIKIYSIMLQTNKNLFMLVVDKIKLMCESTLITKNTLNTFELAQLKELLLIIKKQCQQWIVEQANISLIQKIEKVITNWERHYATNKSSFTAKDFQTICDQVNDYLKDIDILEQAKVFNQMPSANNARFFFLNSTEKTEIKTTTSPINLGFNTLNSDEDKIEDESSDKDNEGDRDLPVKKKQKKDDNADEFSKVYEQEDPLEQRIPLSPR